MSNSDCSGDPEVTDFPIGITATGMRSESDSMGSIDVPADRYWGAQTQRSLQHFSIGDDRMPSAVYRAYGRVKKAAAVVNGDAGRLQGWQRDLIVGVCEEVIDGRLDDHFPLFVWQTGSGTQSNMNVNEVISNRCIQLTGGELGSKTPIHPNDHVNMGQSSNDTFPTAMHIATVAAISDRLLPAVRTLHTAVQENAVRWRDIIKVGRTHLEDAVPLTVGQEWSGYASQIRQGIDRVDASLQALYQLAMGGTAVGTGLNAPDGFGVAAAVQIAVQTGLPYVSAENKFAALGGLDAMVAASAALRSLAVVLLKIANDIRWSASGPRAGLAELILPANEPGSSIMPGKVNPTQCEAMVMVCIQVLADDTAVAFAGSQGNFELNAMRPIVIDNVLHSATIMADMCTKFTDYCVSGIELNRDTIAGYVSRSLMLVTALSPIIGYEKAAAIAHRALADDSTLRDAALATGYIDGDDFDRIIDPRAMVGIDIANET
ncbi:fumarate hydratase, class II [Rhodococcus sp. 06-235-1A]|uniref:class II fumarate hydratase n=1 Tax=Rhodococcus sp. 06-235-1A TaxID=2022508 RepID=UPI000B9AC34B|nr:class II fumarate hydratase [Rhodococcus sp. 06-235-1A]OZD06528.1 fumarate hydratase, class II [Rhodococcus sp. 06-235-1A]